MRRTRLGKRNTGARCLLTDQHSRGDLGELGTVSADIWRDRQGRLVEAITRTPRGATFHEPERRKRGMKPMRWDCHPWVRRTGAGEVGSSSHAHGQERVTTGRRGKKHTLDETARQLCTLPCLRAYPTAWEHGCMEVLFRSCLLSIRMLADLHTNYSRCCRTSMRLDRVF